MPSHIMAENIFLSVLKGLHALFQVTLHAKDTMPDTHFLLIRAMEKLTEINTFESEKRRRYFPHF